jgi:hypothetical protein
MRSIILILSFSFLCGTNVPFKVGESLNYKASFSGIDAATGRLEVLGIEKINNVSTYHVQFSANTHGFANFLFPIRDVIDLWLDENSLVPIRVKKNISERKYKKKSVSNLFQNQGFAIVRNDTISNDTISMGMGTHSPYSLFYFFRNKNLSKIDGEIFTTIEGKKVTPLKMKVTEGINIAVPVGDFNCTEVTPMRIDNKEFKNEATMSIWFSNDKHRYPVQIWIKMKFGAFVLKLDEITN